MGGNTFKTVLIRRACSALGVAATMAFCLASAKAQDSQFISVAHRGSCSPGCPCPCEPGATEGGQPSEEQRPGEAEQNESPDVDLNEQFAAFGNGSFAAADVIGGYIDPASINTRVRLRYDSMKGANFPDRAGYMYPAPVSIGGPGPAFGNVASNLDMDALRLYAEYAFNPRFSVFGEVPAVFVHDLGIPGNGLGDINAGLRVGLIADEDSFLTAQVRAYAPSGDAARGDGTGHASIEGGLLFQTRLSCRSNIFGELLDWQSLSNFRVDNTNDPTDPLNGDLFNGNVLQFGLGYSYDLWQASEECNMAHLTAVFEVVGWTVLDGLKTDAAGLDVLDAKGDTIVNGKYGLRYTLPSGRASIYAGYGDAWTQQRWYNDIVRVELTYNF